MRSVIVGMMAFVALLPSPVLAWGPITHLEIAEMQGGTSNDYQAGCLLPDFSLAYRMGYGSAYPNLQSVTHSPEFRGALAEVASVDFLAGWDSHLYADTIETPYSKAKIQAGAPCGADFVVDYAYPKRECPILGQGYISERYVQWIGHALDAVGCETDYPPEADVAFAYRAYITRMVEHNRTYYKQTLADWYADYAEYVLKAANLPEPPPPPPPPPPPAPRVYHKPVINTHPESTSELRETPRSLNPVYPSMTRCYSGNGMRL